MKVSRVIELLSELNPDDEIACSWWESNLFSIDNVHGTPLPADSEEWINAVANFDAEGGYDTINRQMWELINYAITGEGEF